MCITYTNHIENRQLYRIVLNIHLLQGGNRDR